MSLQLQWWAFQCARNAKSLQEEEKSNDAVALADHGDADAHGNMLQSPASRKESLLQRANASNAQEALATGAEERVTSGRRRRKRGGRHGHRCRAGRAGTAAREGPHRRCATQFSPRVWPEAGSRAKVAMAVRLVRARRAATASEALYARATVATEARGLADEPANSPRPPGARLSSRSSHRGSTEPELDVSTARRAVPPVQRRDPASSTDLLLRRMRPFPPSRTSGSHVRKSQPLRDGRICSECGVDAGAAYEAAKKAVREARVQGAPSAEAALALSVAGGPLRARHASQPRAETARWGGRGGRGRGGGGFRGGTQPACKRVVLAGRPSCGSARGRWVLFAENMRTPCSGCHAKVTAEQAARRAQDRRKGKAAASTVARAGPGTLVLGLQGATAAAAAPSRGVSDHTHGRAYASCGTVGARQSTAPWATVLSNDENADHQQPWLGPSSSSNSSCGSSCGGDGTGDESDGEGSDVGDEAEDDEDDTHSCRSEVRHRASTTSPLLRA